MAEVVTAPSTVEEKFQAALNVIKSLPKNGSYKPSPSMMLKFYSYYKQATEGPCTKSKPWAWDVINKAKWDAWSKLGDMSKTKAMERYVENLKLIIEAMPATDDVQGFIRTLGNFYEAIELEPPNQFKKFSKTTSTPQKNGDVPPLINGNGSAHRINGNLHLDQDSESDNAEEEIENDHTKTNGNANFNKDEEATSMKEQELEGDDAHSESEDEFCDTAEEIRNGDDSPMHSYTIVNNDGHADSSSSKSDSLSTLDETMDGENSFHKQGHTSTGTVKVRTRGGEHGTRGSDRTTSSQQQAGGRSHSGTGGKRSPQDRELDGGGMGVGGGNGGRGPPYSYSEVQDQIATTLLQLQQDMNSVLNRLSILEALTVGQQARRGRTISGESSSSGGSPQHKSKEVPSPWWPFSELSPKTVIFILAWPFVAKWIMHVLSKKRLRR